MGFSNSERDSVRLREELARLWNDTRLRIEYCPRPVSLAVVSGAAGLALIGTALSWPATNPAAPENQSRGVQANLCQEQTWPYLTGSCVRQESAPTPGDRAVRVIPIMAGSSAGATPWTPKGTAHTSKRVLASQERPLSATSQNGRHSRQAAPRRRAEGPMDDAFRAYGQAR